MQVKVGSYTGNGSDNHGITGIGFQPDLVLVEGIAANANAQFRTSVMGANKSVRIRSDTACVTDGIKVLDADGFTLGTNADVNTNTTVYYYIAVKDNGLGDFHVGSYTGDASDGLAVTGTGFQPNYVLIKADSTKVGASKYSSGTDSSMQFGGANRTDLIVSLDANGFTVNNGSSSGGNLVNISGATHYYFAFKEVTGFCTVFQYTGNASDDRDITTPGFQPSVVLIKGESTDNPYIRTSAHSGDNSQHWDFTQETNRIQAFSSTGFQVGTVNVNANLINYNAFVLKEGTIASGPANLKSINGLVKASVKSYGGLAIASVKSIDALT